MSQLLLRPVTWQVLKTTGRAEISTVQVSALSKFFKLPGCRRRIFQPRIAAVYKAEGQCSGGAV
jgi:hypothetical protein